MTETKHLDEAERALLGITGDGPTARVLRGLVAHLRSSLGKASTVGLWIVEIESEDPSDAGWFTCGLSAGDDKTIGFHLREEAEKKATEWADGMGYRWRVRWYAPGTRPVSKSSPSDDNAAPSPPAEPPEALLGTVECQSCGSPMPVQGTCAACCSDESLCPICEGNEHEPDALCAGPAAFEPDARLMYEAAPGGPVGVNRPRWEDLLEHRRFVYIRRVRDAARESAEVADEVRQGADELQRAQEAAEPAEALPDDRRPLYYGNEFIGFCAADERKALCVFLNEKRAKAHDASQPATPNAEPAVWRVGRKLGRTLYRGDKLVGLVDSPEDAAAIVEAMSRGATPHAEPSVKLPAPLHGRVKLTPPKTRSVDPEMVREALGAEPNAEPAGELVCSRCCAPVSRSYEPGRCHVDDCEPPTHSEHDEAITRGYWVSFSRLGGRFHE